MKPPHRFENPAVESYRDLLVWRKGMETAKQVYALTRTFPADEKFGLTAQMRRAAVSIPSNIAEGQARRTTGEFVQSLSYAEGSVAELATQLLLSVDLGFLSAEEAAATLTLLDEIRRMLNGLRRKLEATK